MFSYGWRLSGARPCAQRSVGRFGERGLGKLQGAGAVAAHFDQARSAADHAVEFFDEEVDGVVAFAGNDGSVAGRAIDLHVPLGNKSLAGVAGLQVAFELNANAEDAFFVAEKAVGLFGDKRFERRRQLEVDAGYYQFVCFVLSVHDYVFSLVFLTKFMSSSPMVSAKIRRALGRYSTVIITGGSSGIGRVFIERLHKVAPNLVFFNLSRRAPGMFQEQLNLRHVPCDLSDPAALAAGAEKVLSELKLRTDGGGILLINNSGFGGYGRVSEVGREHQLEMIDVNVRAVVDLTTRLLPVIEERGGTVLNVASLAGYLPTAYTATYGATKAFVLNWTLALDAELRRWTNTGGGGGERTSAVWALAVCPGPVATEFFRRAGLREGAAGDALSFTAEGVVDESIRALARGRSVCLPGWRPRWVARLVSVLPRAWVARIGAGVLTRYRMSRVTGGGAGAKGGGRGKHERALRCVTEFRIPRRARLRVAAASAEHGPGAGAHDFGGGNRGVGGARG